MPIDGNKSLFVIVGVGFSATCCWIRFRNINIDGAEWVLVFIVKIECGFFFLFICLIFILHQLTVYIHGRKRDEWLLLLIDISNTKHSEMGSFHFSFKTWMTPRTYPNSACVGYIQTTDLHVCLHWTNVISAKSVLHENIFLISANSKLNGKTRPMGISCTDSILRHPRKIRQLFTQDWQDFEYGARLI